MCESAHQTNPPGNKRSRSKPNQTKPKPNQQQKQTKQQKQTNQQQHTKQRGNFCCAMKRALIVVDVQNDFCPPDGSLAVPDGDKVVDVINEMVREGKWDAVVFSKDWHPANHCSFALASPPQYRDGSWPPHCVQETRGAQLHSRLQVPGDAIVVHKGTAVDRDAYSAFQGTALGEALEKRGVREVTVVGLATDYCVQATATDAAALGLATTVYLPACRGVAAESTAAAIEALRSRGVRVLS
jgi:nicotinamidase/pyrazinamidase